MPDRRARNPMRPASIISNICKMGRPAPLNSKTAARKPPLSLPRLSELAHAAPAQATCEMSPLAVIPSAAQTFRTSSGLFSV